MSWISVDYLVRSIKFLSNTLSSSSSSRARIFNYQAEQHIKYADLAAVLCGGRRDEGEDEAMQQSVRTVELVEWFRALRASQNPEMIMQAEVLEQWFEAGWTPFALEGETQIILKREARLEAPVVTREFLLKQVVGNIGF